MTDIYHSEIRHGPVYRKQPGLPSHRRSVQGGGNRGAILLAFVSLVLLCALGYYITLLIRA